jgi:site-specific DNA-methyltransferase (adenine-specific)
VVQQIWNIPRLLKIIRPISSELATRLVRMFSFVGDTVLDPFCGTGTTMVAALKYQRNSIGVEIDPEYCRMAAAYLKNESNDLFNDVELIFEKAEPRRTAWVVKENPELYEVNQPERNYRRISVYPLMVTKMKTHVKKGLTFSAQGGIHFRIVD